MNSFKALILISTVMGLSACVKKTEYTPPDINISPKYEDILKSLKSGGQPGEISLNGVAVKSNGTLDDRINIVQTVGTSAEKTEISPSNLPKLNAELKRKDDYKASKFDTYLNVGCDLKGDSRIEGMTEAKNKANEFGITDTFGSVASMVDKVFICGKVELKELIVIINANELILDNALLSMVSGIGLISMTSDILSIEGKNLILTNGVSDSTASLLPAPSIKLNIFERILGTGALKLKSAGGNYIVKDAK